MDMDIAIDNTLNGSLTVIYGYGNGTFTSAEVHSTGIGSHPCFAVTGDFNNDNRLDLATVNEGTNIIGVFLSFAYATFKIGSSYSTGAFSWAVSVVVANFNNDHLLDFAVANQDADKVMVFLAYDNGSLREQTTFSILTSFHPYSIAAGDFNNDGASDIAIAFADADKVGICYGYGNGSFREQFIFSTGNNACSCFVAVGNFDNDSFLDVAVANFYASNVGIYIGSKNGTFIEQNALLT
ncbi:unnamed protein product [Rotaria magnacalcarata]|uniref:VCBS repeat-containing protein n=1 Tax=Rotaria magnacalcarata TaxID=392030 RepID=A0A815V4J9_9BILA|nr:unnamed protein product [Rotaria magnacalcarata]CAF4294193.1 unnamed protein product [Rotaria magnacalcarata]